MLAIPSWLISDKGDREALALADRHYTRRAKGSSQFCRNGQNLVFVTSCARAAWVTFRPTPGKATRQDGLDAWECALFRNEGAGLSSHLIREAVYLTVALWGVFPRDGLFTYVKPEAVQTEIPGYCFRRAGWVRWGSAADGKPRLRAPRPVDEDVPHWRNWDWKGDRGGKLRRLLDPTYRGPKRRSRVFEEAA